MTEEAISAETTSASSTIDDGATPPVIAPLSSENNLYHGTNVAAAEGAAVAAMLRAGVFNIIDAGVNRRRRASAPKSPHSRSRPR
jgi:hypothetical protein